MLLCRTLVAIAASISICIPAAFAQDADRSMSMISVFEVDPAKEKQFDDSWKAIRDIAIANGYPYTVYAGGYRNQRWIATPVRNFADVDAVYAARDAVFNAGGKKFEKALEKFISAQTSSHTFFATEDKELSYAPEGASEGNYMEIDTLYYRYGAQDKMRKVLADFKALMESKNSPYAYGVNWDGLGSIGNSVTIITTAASPVAMAKADVAVNAMLEGDEAWEGILAGFQAINTGSQTIHSNFNPEASIMPAAEE